MSYDSSGTIKAKTFYQLYGKQVFEKKINGSHISVGWIALVF